ncbi:ABC transporter permease [Actomonas aquatica]|uniref:ABC transporter permease n=1 Tax=Actomonas aquatica TaxID=2866162 RepID=A0ABZ1C290_9BACT|nr:ABC transporter permease [Opitutus sp. WL0086]WRQ85784.1 ABC transporter permease [Opitutus sp. WL0086]
MLHDLRLALRNLRSARGFTLVATLTLAVGIGSATAMFSALRALVVHPFNFPESDRLVMVWSGDGWPLSPADFLTHYEDSTSFESFGVYSPESVNVGERNAQVVNGINTTHGALAALGIQPLRGRLLTPEDEVKGAPPVAVIDYALWQSAFAGAEDLIGRTVRLNGGDVTVVGIMPPAFEFPGPWIRTELVQVFLPITYLEESRDSRDSHWLCGLARLKPGVSVAAADAEIKTIGARLSELYPDSNTNKKFLVRSLHYEMTHDIGDDVWMLFGAVAMVLLVACANVASMLLARSARRQGEFAVRVALGATRRDLVRLALTESLALALAGAVLGLFFAYGGVAVLKSIAPISEARSAAMGLDGTVLLFAGGATALTALLAGVPPALAAVRTSLNSVIRTDARGAVGSKSRHHMLRALVIAQIAVAFVLANGAVLFSAAYLKLLEENQLLATENVVTAKLTLRGERYEENEQRVAAWRDIEQRLAALPGVTAVGLTSKLPLEGGSNTNALVNDEVYDPTQRRTQVERSSVSADYFATMGLTLLQGRLLRDEDDMQEDGRLGIVVNRTFVERAWPDQNPIGQVIRANQPADPWYTATVVGVVEDVKQWGAGAPMQPEMYTTPPGHWGNRVHLNLRSPQNASALIPQVRAVIAAYDPELAIEDPRTLQQVVLDSTEGQRVVAGLVNFFMGIALGLVAVGLYGTLSYHVVQRTREIGVRMAIGALKGDILSLIFGQGLRWVLVGVVLGIGGIFALAKVLASLVYDMDGLTLAPVLIATGAVAVATVVATLIPAWRAARMNPIEALRLD